MRILIANPFGIGDVLFTLPLLQALREQDPEGFIGYLGNRRTTELIGAWPEVSWQAPFEFRTLSKQSRWRGWKELAGSARRIRQQRFDLLIDLSLGWAVGCAAFLAGVPRRIGLNYRDRGRFLTEKIRFTGFRNQPVGDTYLDLLPLIGFQRPRDPAFRMALDPKKEEAARAWLREQGVDDRSRLLGLVPGGGASWGSAARFKQWPPDRFAQVADELAQRHGADILLIGDQDDQPVCREVARAMRRTPKQIGPAPSIIFLAHAMKRCALVIGNDSGPMHLADAVGVKTLAIFGPVDASIYGPPGRGQGSSRKVAAHGLACRPCYRDFRFPPCPWDNACLKQLEPREIIRAAEEILGDS